jgi:hypothetical protein
MQNRQEAVASDREVGHLNPEKAYAFIDSVRVAFDVGALGLGATGNISRPSSIITAVTVEGFCSALSLIVAVHESVDVCCQQCCRRDGRTVDSTNHPATQYSTYIAFRMASIAASFAGMILLAVDLAADTVTAKTTIGIVALSMGIFASRALSSSPHKAAGTMLHVDDNALVNDIEMGGAPEAVAPVYQPVPAVAVVMPADDRQPPLVSDAARPNQFFQPQSAPAAPLRAASTSASPAIAKAPVKKGYKAVRKKR